MFQPEAEVLNKNYYTTLFIEYLKGEEFLKNLRSSSEASFEMKFIMCLLWAKIRFIHSFSILSDDRSKASSKTIPPFSAI